ncbi:MAG TPA: hypothetical protein VI387_13295, partial [Candidatus Brocadiales bacterium]|nr:hypothetical protein [Candidatus Brocadiales bacterium]
MIPAFLLRIGKLIWVIGLPLLVILCNGLLPSTSRSVLANQVIERIDKGEFYYSGGKKIPLIRHKNLFAVKLKVGAIHELPLPVLERNKGLKLSEKSKFFERHKIHLLESCDEGNGKKHDDVICCLRDDPDVEYVQPVFVTGANEPMVLSDCFVAKFTGKLSRKEIDEINAKNGVEIVKSIDVDSNVFVLRAT